MNRSQNTKNSSDGRLYDKIGQKARVNIVTERGVICKIKLGDKN